MKFLLFLAIFLLAVWLWRSGRQGVDRSDNKPAAPQSPQEMVRCAYCGVHLPRSDALTGRAGLYCSAEHRHSAEP